jgi:cobalt/nickel transport system permease protein
MRIDYYAHQSGMFHWNSRYKVVLALVTLCLVIGCNQIPVSLYVIVTMGLLTLRIGKLPWRVYLRYLTLPLWFLVISCVMLAVNFSTQETGDWSLWLGWFSINATRESMELAVQVFFKAMAGVSSLYMMTFSTPMGCFIQVLQQCHMPQVLVELMHLIYRYIFILLDVAQEMQTAAKARLGYRSLSQGFRSFAMVAGNLFMVSFQKANHYYDAMVARGYQGQLAFLQEETMVTGRQLVAALLYLAVLVGIYVLTC